jgi:fatty acid desaturase
MTITIFIATLRAIAEHQRTSFNIIVEGRAGVRNFNCSFISRIIFGSYGFGEHLTHHEFPAIPYYRLKKATFELSKENEKYRPSVDYPGVLHKIIIEK